MEVEAPEIHGKLAGAKAPAGPVQAVQVTINMGGALRDIDDPAGRPTVTISPIPTTTGCGGAGVPDEETGAPQPAE
jgi:hypothetical protein